MATGTYAPDPFEQYCDDDGNPLSSGTLTTFLAGLSTPATTYSDVNLTIANTNPISLDAAGRPTSGAIFLTPGVSYKFVLKDVLGATVASRDYIAAVPLNPNVTGVWTPVIGGSTSTSGQTYVFQSGIYVKLGTMVIASFQVQLSAKGSIVGSLSLNGLPFQNSTYVYTNPLVFWNGLNTPMVGMSLVLNSSVNAGSICGIPAATVGPSFPVLSTADITDNFELLGTFIYTTTS
jgi:hypothetical protein